MKIKSLFALFALLAFLLVSCGDDLSTDMLKQIQPAKDAISIYADTFHVSSETVAVDYTVSNPDSVFLLGKFVDDIYGGTNGDIITQFHYNDDYSYMDTSIAETYSDSTVLTISFDGGAYFGDTLSPIQFNVYELKNSLVKNTNYYTNVEPSQYADFTKLCGQYTQTIHQADTNSVTGEREIRIKLSDDFTNRFFNTDKSIFENQENFNSFFKGLYITTGINSSALIKASGIELHLYCHYVYKSDNSVFKMPAVNFPVTSEVTSINRIEHPQRNTSLISYTDTNFIVSPANLYTKIKIPIGRIKDHIKVSADKDTVINSVILTLNAVNKDKMALVDGDSIGTAFPYVNNLLLIKGTLDDVENFFKNKETVDNETSFLASLSSEGSSTEGYTYYYTFSGLKTLIQTELEKVTSSNDNVDMYVVPVRLIYDSSSSSSYTSLAPASGVGAVGILSGKNKTTPMRLEVVYSAF